MLSFLPSPWILLGLVLFWGVSVAGVGYKAYRIAQTECHEAELRAEVEDLNRQISVWKVAAEDAERSNKELEKENADAEKLVDEIRTNAGACKFTVDQRCRMLRLAGGVCKPAAPPQ